MTGEMSISVRFFGVLGDRLPADADCGQILISVPLCMDVAGVLARLGVPAGDGRLLVVMVNGRQVSLDHILERGDVLSAFPALAGG
jgi:sulfur carrier protein ThiS